MTARAGAGKPANIRFTRDWHELLGGDLRPGRPLLLRYDPARIVPGGDPYVFGDPRHPITAWIDFGVGELPRAVILQSHVGMLLEPHRDLTGHGSMLVARVEVPADATGVTVWFSYLSHGGVLQRDDDHGARFRFGFCANDIAVRASYVADEGATSFAQFGLRVAAHANVTAVRVRWRIIGDQEASAQEADLSRGDEQESSGWNIWQVDDLKVPSGAKLIFKLYYWIGGVRFKDDNSGQHYLAPPPPEDVVPPPPEAIGREAQRW